MVASASSDGVVRVWDVRVANKDDTKPLAEAVTKSRLTCLAGSSLKSVRPPKLGVSAVDKDQDAAAEAL
ncbi:hypothetical protein Vadar_031485 [Vaccinium darrowii]|uniref:Uncharacterized protein n=1 Tax=Vaccinium darrowii TaxID=229202 RepID=A0ACB7Y4F2_9ERIC|nr:hypothetical protein Vadar_031485 [Vaccinium darrowii]